MSPADQERVPKAMGPDGVVRPAEAERMLNALFVAVFGSVEGEKVFEHLREITVHRVNGPEATDAQLRHHEGMRFLFQVIAARVNRGRKQ